MRKRKECEYLQKKKRNCYSTVVGCANSGYGQKSLKGLAMNSRKIALVSLALATLALTGCGPYSKEVGDNPDPGRVVTVENTELVKRQLGNTTIYMIGDKETQSCVAQTERVGPWWGSPSVSIAPMPPEACGFPPKVVKTEVVNMPPPAAPPKAPPTPAAAVTKKKTAPPLPPTPCPVCKTSWRAEGQPSGASAILAPFLYTKTLTKLIVSV